MQFLETIVTGFIEIRSIERAYHHPVRMPPFVLCEFFAATKAGRAYVDAIPDFAYGVCALYANGMSEVAGASVTFNLKTRLIHSWGWIYVTECVRTRGLFCTTTWMKESHILWISSG